jgi:hypothetical protein
MAQQFAYFPLGGGLDLITPAIAKKPGCAISALNYEPALTGYRRVEGYERFDGRQSPTDAPYWQLSFTNASLPFAGGLTVVGAESGATGLVLDDAVLTSGTYESEDGSGYMGLASVSGTFVDGEVLQLPGSSLSLEDGSDLLMEDSTILDFEAVSLSGVILSLEDGSDLDMEDGSTPLDLEIFFSGALAFGTAELLTAPDDPTATTWQRLATELARAAILQIPGSGPVRGVWNFRDTVYGFRDSLSGGGAMWKATSTGWVSVPLGFTLDFTSGGTYVPQEGDVITGATSAQTATVQRIVTTSGSWSAGTAAGYLVLASASGAFVAENLNVGANINVATIAGDKVAITLPAGGRYEFVNHNFYGASQLQRMYGCNGIGRAFEFDGAVFTPIHSGMTVDTPFMIAEHKEHLWLFFPGGAFQNSSIGAPLDWSAVTGAALYGMGDEITGVISDNAGVMSVLAANKVANLYGSSAADFQLITLNKQAGALAHSAQLINKPIYMDSIGVRSLSATQAFGDFNIGTLSDRVQPLLQDYRKTRVVPVAAFTVRKKNHYRVIFSNNQGLAFDMGKKQPEVLPFDWGKAVTCIGSFETSSGERVFFGSDDGFVYEAEKGYSFDGNAIDHALRLPFNHEGAPQTNKRWHKITMECQAIPTATISVSADFDYGDPFEAGVTPADVAAQVFTVTGGGGIWDTSNWNQFFWSSATEGLMEAYLDGVGRNMSLLIAGSTSDEPPHLLQGLTLFFSERGLQR